MPVIFAPSFPGVTRRSTGLATLPGHRKNRTLLLELPSIMMPQLEMPQKSVGGLRFSPDLPKNDFQPSVRQVSIRKHGKNNDKEMIKSNRRIFRDRPFLDCCQFEAWRVELWRTKHAWHVHALQRCEVEVIHQLLQGETREHPVRCT